MHKPDVTALPVDRISSILTTPVDTQSIRRTTLQKGRSKNRMRSQPYQQTPQTCSKHSDHITPLQCRDASIINLHYQIQPRFPCHDMSHSNCKLRKLDQIIIENTHTQIKMEQLVVVLSNKWLLKPKCTVN